MDTKALGRLASFVVANYSWGCMAARDPMAVVPLTQAPTSQRATRIMRIVPFGLMLLLTACATTGPTPRFLHEVPKGTVLSLERPLPFRANSVRVYLQNGKVYPRLAILMNYGGANQYQPYCALELQRAPASALTLSPRKFVIVNADWDTTYEFFDKSIFRTRWRLSSGGTPQALYFTCYRLGSESHDTPIRLEEVDSIVGDYFRLLPAESTVKPAPTTSP